MLSCCALILAKRQHDETTAGWLQLASEVTYIVTDGAATARRPPCLIVDRSSTQGGRAQPACLRCTNEEDISVPVATCLPLRSSRSQPAPAPCPSRYLPAGADGGGPGSGAGRAGSRSPVTFPSPDRPGNPPPPQVSPRTGLYFPLPSLLAAERRSRSSRASAGFPLL